MNARARMIAGGWVVVPVVLSALFSPAAAQHPIPENQRWATITHAGNAAYEFQNHFGETIRRGRVDYDYQISRTEVTAGEWVEFVRAYAPYVDPQAAGSSFFTSNFIQWVAPQTYVLPRSFENLAVGVDWRYAARFCNWLHNGKANTRETFERGVYDSSTFGLVNGVNGRDGYTDQAARSPGATYWLPTIDEWTKAAYFDPDRYGPDQPGYWTFPHSSDTQPRYLTHPEGGQSSIGYLIQIPVATFRDVQSPWGLWDLSGGQSEWLETAELHSNGAVSQRLIKGTDVNDSPQLFAGAEFDQIDRDGAGAPLSRAGIRIARVVPSPGSVCAVAAVVPWLIRRRRQLT